MDALDEWMAEHRFLEHLLEALEQCVEAAEHGDLAARADAASFAELLRGIDRTWHQAAEEQLLLPALRAHGFAEEGMVAGVRKEHEQAKELLRELGAVARGEGSTDGLAEAAYCYTDHARCHIYTEEALLFPAVRARLSAPAVQELHCRLHAFLSDAELAIEGLRRSAASLASRYAAPPACIDPRVSWRGTED